MRRRIRRAIVDALCERCERALDSEGRSRALRSVAASPPTACFAAAWRRSAPNCTLPPLSLCTDNAAMIASAARYGEILEYPAYLALDAYATGERAAA